MTAKELSVKIGISEGALSLSINGNPTLSRLQEIANALDVEISELFAPSYKCPKCGAKLQIIECVEEPLVLAKPTKEEQAE